MSKIKDEIKQSHLFSYQNKAFFRPLWHTRFIRKRGNLMEQFLEDIKDLEVTTVARAQEAIDTKETATFFIGRKTCPYCRKFAAKLATVVAETKAHIYFINSEEPSQLDALQAFRSTYGIPTVPGFLHVEAGEVSVRCDSSMSEEEIKTFAHL